LRIVCPQRLDDAGQVVPDGAFGIRWPAFGDRVRDVQVLGQRHLRTAGPEGELELVPDQLRVQPFEQSDGDRLAGDYDDPAVQFPVELGVLDRVAVGDRALEALGELAQAGRLVIGDLLGRLRRAQRLQGHPAFGDRDGLLAGDDADPGATVRDSLNEPFGSEVEQRGAQRLPRHAQRACQLLFDKPLSRREVSAEDGPPERAEGVQPRRLSGAQAVGRSCC
jgi:hypothetical protein